MCDFRRSDHAIPKAGELDDAAGRDKNGFRSDVSVRCRLRISCVHLDERVAQSSGNVNDDLFRKMFRPNVIKCACRRTWCASLTLRIQCMDMLLLQFCEKIVKISSSTPFHHHQN